MHITRLLRLSYLPDSFNLLNVGIAAVTLLVTAAAFLLHRVGIFDLLAARIDPTSTRNGGDLVAAVLKAHGVKFIFTLIGGHVSSILVEADRLGIRIIDTRHEVTTVFAADAVARLTGRVGVACVTAGPGLTNTVTAVKNAQMAESPILLLGGAAATLLKGKGALQDIDQLSLFKSLCKHTATVTRVRDIVPVLRRAICIAQSDTPGPVFVELPIDVLYPYSVVSKEVTLKSKARGLVQSVVHLYLKAYVTRLFAGAWERRDMSPLAPHYPLPRASSIGRVAKLLKGAKKPVVVLGSQTMLPPVRAEKVRHVLECLGIPCFLGGMTRGLLGRNSDIHIRQKRGEALKEADVVLLVGALTDFRLSYGRIFSRKSKVVAVNRSMANLKMNAGSLWHPHLLVQADPGLFLASLHEEMGEYKCDPAWPRELKKRDQDKEAKNAIDAEKSLGEYLNPLKLLGIVEDVLEDDSILVADGGDFVGSAAYILRPRGPLRWLDPGAFGTLGVGAGFALGAKLCHPESDVWIIYGDGSLGFSIPEFDTFVRHKIPVMALVGNDACWTQILRGQVDFFKSDVGCNLRYTNYEEVVKGFGGEGYRIEGKDSDIEIRAILKSAQKTSRGGSPVLVNCLIGKTNFRDGSISV